MDSLEEIINLYVCRLVSTWVFVEIVERAIIIFKCISYVFWVAQGGISLMVSHLSEVGMFLSLFELGC